MSLTDKERQLAIAAGTLMNGFKEIQDDFLNEFPDKFEKHGEDWIELCVYIHQLQNWILSNSAARCHPEEFRPFGLKHTQEYKDSVLNGR